jgi:signal transduction histidine kinase
VRRLKALYGAAVFVTVQSGQDDETARTAAFDGGADDFLAKPVAAADLRRRMVAAARSQQAYVESRLAREATDRLLTYGAEANALLAHDLNNGLAVALTNINFLADVLELGDEEGQALAATRRALRRMAGLVANFVDIARFEDAAMKPRVEEVAVRAMLDEVMDLHAPPINHNIRPVVECETHLTGVFDASLIERILHNLVGNAARYCNPGGVLRVAAQRWDVADPMSIEITVQNTGPSIPDELRANLFGKYSKGVNGKRGIGLYFCRLACEAHGGKIEHRSLPDGPAFVVSLPGRR